MAKFIAFAVEMSGTPEERDTTFRRAMLKRLSKKPDNILIATKRLRSGRPTIGGLRGS
jgi:hypothetical protein